MTYFSHGLKPPPRWIDWTCFGYYIPVFPYLYWLTCAICILRFIKYRSFCFHSSPFLLVKVGGIFCHGTVAWHFWTSWWQNFFASVQLYVTWNSKKFGKFSWCLWQMFVPNLGEERLFVGFVWICFFFKPTRIVWLFMWKKPSKKREDLARMAMWKDTFPIVFFGTS